MPSPPSPSQILHLISQTTFFCVQSSVKPDLHLCRHVSRISLRERPKLRGAPRLGGPRGPGPKVSPIKNRKLRGFGPLFFSWSPLAFLFPFLLFNLILLYRSGGGLGPRAPPPPLDTCLWHLGPHGHFGLVSDNLTSMVFSLSLSCHATLISRPDLFTLLLILHNSCSST